MKKNIKKITAFILVIIMATLISCKTTTTASSPFIPTEGLSIDQFLTEYQCDEEELATRQDLSHQMAECARALGYPEDCEIIQTAKMEWQSAQDERQLNTEAIEFWTKRYEEYPYATYIWLYCTEILGCNNYVAAGILGNIMAEVGGGTLNIRYWLYGIDNEHYYGMCQWYDKYCFGIQGTDLIYQCQYLGETIKTEIDNYGYMYSYGYTYDDFLNLQSAEQAALMFAASYERCGSTYY